jgi:hypothetical protein
MTPGKSQSLDSSARSVIDGLPGPASGLSLPIIFNGRPAIDFSVEKRENEKKIIADHGQNEKEVADKDFPDSGFRFRLFF